MTRIYQIGNTYQQKRCKGARDLAMTRMYQIGNTYQQKRCKGTRDLA